MKGQRATGRKAMVSVSELLRVALRAEVAIDVSSRQGARLCKSHATSKFLRIPRGPQDDALFARLVSCATLNMKNRTPSHPVAFNSFKEEAYIALSPGCSDEYAVAGALKYMTDPHDLSVLYEYYGSPKMLVFDFVLGKHLRLDDIAPCSSVAVCTKTINGVDYLSID